MTNKNRIVGICILISLILILIPFISSETYNTVNSVFYDFTWNVSSDSVAYILSVDVTSHKVGIGTANPFQKLHVAGSILANGTINATTDLCIQGGTCLSTVAAAGEPLWTANYTAFNASWSSITNTSYMTGANFTLQNISMKNYVDIQNTSQTNAMTAQNTSQTNYINVVAARWNDNYTNMQTNCGSSFVTGIYANGTFMCGSAGAETDPKWTANWTNVACTNIHETFTENVTFAKNISVDGNTLYVDSNNDRVGIGTTSPGYNLVVNGSAGSLAFDMSGTIDGNPYLRAFDSSGSPTNFNFAGGAFFTGNLYGSNFGDGSTNKQWLKLTDTTTSLWTNGSERVTVLNNGNVGIGTSSPQQRLHVNGSILANGTINATGGFGVNGKSGITGNYTLGNCWQSYAGGIMYKTNCTSI